MAQLPSIGRIVHYTLGETDAQEINRRREDARQNRIPADHMGSVVHTGNSVKAGDVYPVVITRCWADPIQMNSSVNGQVMLDGNDVFWATSVYVGEPGEQRRFVWPTRS